MRKKRVLAILVTISLMQGTAIANADINYDFFANDDIDFRDMMMEQTGGYGMLIEAGDTLTIADGKTVTFNSTTYDAGGFGPFCLLKYTFGNAPKPVNVSGGNFIAISDGSDNYGVYIQEESGANFIVNNTNLTFENFYMGFNLKDAETTIKNDETKLINNDYAIYTANDAKFHAESDKFTIKNMNTGIYAKDNTSVELISKEINFNNGSYGLYAKDDANIDIESQKFNIVDTNNGISINDAIAKITTDEFNFTTSQEIDFPITAVVGQNNAQIDIIANKAYLCGEIVGLGNSKINFLKDDSAVTKQTIEIYSDKADAVYGESDDGNAEINFDVDSYINSQGDEIYHADKQGVRTIAAIRALRNSEITLDNAAGIYGDIIAGRGVDIASNAMYMSEDSSIPAGGKISINSVSGAEFKGDVLAGNSGEINFTLNNANYEGRVDDYADATLKDIVFRPEEFDIAVTEGGTVNMELNNSIWAARGQNFVTSLSFGEEGGLVDLSQDENNSVTIRNLKGSGTFNMLLNSEDHSKSDMLYIGKNEGNQTINIVGGITGGLENISEDNPLRFATVGIDSVSDVPDVINSGISAYTRDAGIYDLEYVVDKEKFDKADTENEKYNGNDNGQGSDKPGNNFVENELVGERDAVNWIITGAKEKQESDAGKTIINMSKVNYNNAIYMDRLNKRMGEARYISPEDEQGMWVRIRHDRIGKDNAFRSQNTMYEMGYDVKQDCDNGERRIGMAIDYMDGKAEYSGIAGDGDVKRYGLWLYDTWLGDKGHYADYVLKWGHLENDFDIMARTTGEKITGDYSNNVFSVSAEYGKKNSMGNGWYFEPQAQLQLARVTGADYVTSQGTNVSLDGINSLIGRAGFRLGKDMGELSTVYVKADLLHEFFGDQDISATDVTGTLHETYENKGTWYDVGFGFATAIGKDSYAFMDFEKSFGNDNDETYQINAGVQWTF